MPEPGPEAARAAHALRELAARKGTGVVVLGDGVTAHVRDGLLVRVDADTDAPSFGEHLVLTRALTTQARHHAMRRAEDEGVSFHDVVRTTLGWTDDAFAEALRRHYVRRLSRGLSGDVRDVEVEESGEVADGAVAFAVGPALVEALAAGDDELDAPDLPEGATFVVAEDASPSWTGLGEDEARRVPAERLREAWSIPARARAVRAALLAGFLRIELPVVAVASAVEVERLVPRGDEVPRAVPEMRAPEPRETDPLDDVEGRIVALELTDGAQSEIAAAWREAARVWGNDLSCPEEAARCERNACGAAPTDPEAHLASARFCAALGEHGLAAAQARVAAAHAPAGSPTRAKALELLAMSSWQSGDVENAVEAVAEAVWEAPGEPSLLALGSRLLLEAQRPEESERWRREALSAKHEMPRLDAVASASIRSESPDDVLRELVARVAKDGPAAILTAVEAAIAPAVRVKGTATAVAAALRRVSELGEPALAAAMGIKALDATGNRSPELRDVSRSGAESSGDARLLVAVLERHVAVALVAAHRVELLARIADGWDRLGRPLHAARALTRSLVHLPSDVATLERLAVLYVQAWDAERSFRTIEKLRELAVTPSARADALLRLASVTYRMLGDRARARGYVERALTEPSLDEESRARLYFALIELGDATTGVDALMAMAGAHPDPNAGAKLATAAVLAVEREGAAEQALAVCEKALDRWARCSPLLLAFERLVAPRGTSERAAAVCEQVASRALGPNGRRAVHYRAARLLERMGDLGRSLTAFSKAFGLSPSTGTVLASIERLSEATGTYGPLAEAYARLATRAADASTLVARLRRAADIAETKMGDARGAFEHLLKAFKTYAEPGLEVDLRRLALVLADLGDEGPFDALTGALADRAERSWDVEERLPYLTSLARLRAEHGNLEGALATLAPIATEPEGRPSIEVALEIGRATGAEERVRVWLSDLGVSPTDGSPVHAPATASISPFDEPDRAPDGAVGVSVAAPESEQTSKFEIEETVKAERLVEVGSAPDSPPPDAPTTRSSSPPRASSSSVPPPQVWMSAGPEDEVRLAVRLAREPGQRAGAIHRLRALVRGDPTRTSALRALRDLLVAADATNEATMIGRVIALFEHDAASAPPTFGVPLNHVEGAAAAVGDAETASADEVLAAVWEHARPLFRQELAEHGISDLDRVVASDGSSFARGIAACLHAMEMVGTAVYRKRGSGRRARAVVGPAGQALLVGDLDPTRAGDRFVIGRALEGARAGRAMALALDTVRGTRAMRAVGAAFGRTELSAETERDCISLAAALWQTVPSRVQRKIRTLLEERTLPAPDLLRAAARRAALRSGLLLAGDSLAVVAELASEEPALVAVVGGSEGAFLEACRSSETLTTLVRFATSDAMLSMRWTLPPIARSSGTVGAGGG